jgi:hypothetical protein
MSKKFKELKAWNPKKIDWIYNNIKWNIPIDNLFEHCLSDIKRNSFKKVNEICHDRNNTWKMTYINRETDSDGIYAIQLDVSYCKLEALSGTIPFFKHTSSNIVFVELNTSESIEDSVNVFYRQVTCLINELYQIPDVSMQDIDKISYYTFDESEQFMDKLPISFACPTLGHLIYLILYAPNGQNKLFCMSSNIVEKDDEPIYLWNCYFRLTHSNLLELVVTDMSGKEVDIESIIECKPPVGRFVWDSNLNSELGLVGWITRIINILCKYNDYCVKTIKKEEKNKEQEDNKMDSTEIKTNETSTVNILDAEVTKDGLDVFINIKEDNNITKQYKIASFQYDSICKGVNVYHYDNFSSSNKIKETKLETILLDKNANEIYSLRKDISDIDKELKIQREIIKSLEERRDNKQKELTELTGSNTIPENITIK